MAEDGDELGLVDGPGRMPRKAETKPPIVANAWTSSPSTTVNADGRFGRVLCSTTLQRTTST